MALWQYSFYVLPKEGLITLEETFKFDKRDELFDDALFWREHHIKPTFFDKVGDIIIKNKSWSEDIELYGAEESNCFEVLSENGVVVSVSFRIDFTSDYENILSRLIEFFIFNSLVIADENLNILPLNFEAVKSVIESSPQVVKYNILSGRSGNVK